ncbi:MAG: hypothetical protein LBH69_04910 [Methanomassiliicoccaceae archaeon]|jgi:hypothetical protein|nr:hypothetical protein [Methanomassiliicoccaceae archaeon]
MVKTRRRSEQYRKRIKGLTADQKLDVICSRLRTLGIRDEDLCHPQRFREMAERQMAEMMSYPGMTENEALMASLLLISDRFRWVYIKEIGLNTCDITDAARSASEKCYAAGGREHWERLRRMCALRRNAGPVWPTSQMRCPYG